MALAYATFADVAQKRVSVQARGLDAIPPDTFGSRLERARKRKGLKQWELAQKIGAARKGAKDGSYISLLEGDKIPNPTSHTVEKLAGALNVAVHELALDLPWYKDLNRAGIPIKSDDPLDHLDTFEDSIKSMSDAKMTPARKDAALEITAMLRTLVEKTRAKS